MGDVLALGFCWRMIHRAVSAGTSRSVGHATARDLPPSYQADMVQICRGRLRGLMGENKGKGWESPTAAPADGVGFVVAFAEAGSSLCCLSCLVSPCCISHTQRRLLEGLLERFSDLQVDCA